MVRQHRRGIFHAPPRDGLWDEPATLPALRPNANTFVLNVNTIVLKKRAVRAIMVAMTTMPAVPVDRDKIRELREDLGLTQAQAAKRAGFHGHQQWYAVESGKRLDPSVSTIQRIATALGVTIDELVTPFDGDEWKDA